MSDITTERVCDVLEATLRGPTRSEILDHALKAGDFQQARDALRGAMQSHVFETGSVKLEFDQIVQQLDGRTREEGFHVLQAWDPQHDRFSTESVPVLMLDHAARDEGVPAERRTLGILLDYYFLHVLSLLVLRAWDDGNPDPILDRVTDLLGDLQGPYGSGQPFVDDAETLLIVAVSHFHPQETAYDTLVERAGTLSDAHRIRFAEVSTAVLSCHLRWGFEVMYGHDVSKMRDDNVGDYPWLFFAVSTLMHEYVRMRREGVDEEGRRGVVAALVNGLSADPWAFAGRPPDALEPLSDEYSRYLRLFARYRDDLLEEFEAHRPGDDAYSTLGLHFNFPNNALVAMVTLGLRQGLLQRLSLNALLTPSPSLDGFPENMARELMEYSHENPERLQDFEALLIVYDTQAGLSSFQMSVNTIKKHLV